VRQKELAGGNGAAMPKAEATIEPATPRKAARKKAATERTER